MGDKLSQWTWDDGRITVASIDGVTDEFIVRPGEKPKDAKDGKDQKEPRDKDKDKDDAAPRRRVASDNEREAKPASASKNQTPSWAPWSQERDRSAPTQRTAQPRQQPPGKPKTFFDILLGN
jgi:hypothetical protein